MKGVRNAIVNRVSICCLVVFGSLGLFRVDAHAAKLKDFQALGSSSTGKATTLGITGQAAAFDSRVPMNPINSGQSGWSTAGNFGVPQQATNGMMSMGSDGKVFFADGLGTHGGVSYPFKASVGVGVGTIFDAAAAVASGPVGVAVFAAPFLFDWFTRAGNRVTPSGGIEHSDSPSTSDYFDPATFAICGSNYGYGPQTTCIVVEDGPGVAGCFTTFTKSGGRLKLVRPDNQGFAWADVCPKTSLPRRWIVASLADIAPYMKDSQFSPDGRVIPEILSQGGDIPLPQPTVTGPESVTGPTSSTTNSDGTKTVTQSTYNFKTEGNTITNTTNTTTSTTYNTDNSVKNSSVTTTTPTEEKPPEDECKNNPDRVGCGELDTPSLEIPKESKTITYQEERVFGEGSCPSDVYATVGTIGKTVKVWDWQATCSYSFPLRALVLLLSTFAAMLIVMPGSAVKT